MTDFDTEGALAEAKRKSLATVEGSDFRVSNTLGAPPTPQRLGPASPLQPLNGFDLPASTVRSWMVQTVRAAVDLVSTGFLQDAGDLAQYMKRDSTFTAAMDKRVLGLLRCDFKVTPASDSPLDREVADAVRKFWPTIAPERELKKWVQWYHLLAYSPAFLDYRFVTDKRGRTWTLPIMRSRHPRWFYFDVGSWSWVDIHTTGIRNVDVENGRYVVANEWNYGEFSGKVSSMAEDWIEKVFARRDWAEWSDLYAWPAFKAIIPPQDINSEDDGETSGSEFADKLAAAVRNRVVMVQQDKTGNNTFDFEVVKLSGDEYQGFKDRIEYLDRKMQVGWLGGNLSSEVVDQGARAAANTQMVAETKLIQADNVYLGTVLRDQLVRAFVTENFGFDVDVPDVGWIVGEQEELAAFTRGFKDFMTGLKDMPDRYQVTNIAEIGERLGVRITDAGAAAGSVNNQTVGVPGAAARPAPGTAKPAPDGDVLPAVPVPAPKPGEPAPAAGAAQPAVPTQGAVAQKPGEVSHDVSDLPQKHGAEDDDMSHLPHQRMIKQIGPELWRVLTPLGVPVGDYTDEYSAITRYVTIMRLKSEGIQDADLPQDPYALQAPPDAGIPPMATVLTDPEPVKRTIRKVGDNKWRLYSGSGKNLGTFNSLAAAKKHEAQVQYFKHKNDRDPTDQEVDEMLKSQS